MIPKRQRFKTVVPAAALALALLGASVPAMALASDEAQAMVPPAMVTPSPQTLTTETTKSESGMIGDTRTVISGEASYK